MQEKIVKTFSIVVLITIISKVLGLLRDIAFAYYFGTGYEATAYFTAIRIPTQLLDIGLSAAITATFIPVFNKVMFKSGKDIANSFANNFINIIAVVTTLISVLGIIFAEPIVELLAGGFDGKTFALTVDLIRITFPMIIFTAVAFSFVGFLQSHNEFKIPAMISAISNIAIIVYLIIFHEMFGIYGLSIFMLIAWSLQVIIQIPYAFKKGYRFKWKINFKDENIKNVFKLAIPIIISTSVIPINILVSTRIASGMGDEAVAILEYGYKLFLVAVGVFVYAIGNIIFPEFSRLSIDKEKKHEFIQLIKKGLRGMVFILIPFTIGFILYRTDLVSLLYEHGEFDSVSTMLTSNVLFYYAIGMLGFGFVEIMNKVFYAKQDTKTPVIVGVIMICINIVLCIVLSNILGLNGLALATSCTFLLHGLILLICANVQIKNILDMNSVKYVIKILLATGLMTMAVMLVNNMIGQILLSGVIDQIIRIISGTAIGVLVYFVILDIFEVEELKMLKKNKKKIK